MDTDKTDQQAFDEHVGSTGKLVLQTLAGVGIVAALLMSVIALLISSDNRTSSTPAGPAPVAAAPARTSLPASAQLRIAHVMHGCHNLAVNGGPATSPNATLSLAVGAKMVVQNDDVMPHQLLRRSGPQVQLAQARMSHMGATSTATFPTAGVYRLTSKAGEDYQKGVVTMGADHTLSIKVVSS